MKKIRIIFNLSLIFIIYLLFELFYNNIFSSSQNMDNLNFESEAVLVMDMKSGRVLYEKNGYEKKSIASLTKIMTSIMLVSNCSIEEEIEVPKQIVNVGGSTAGLKSGEKVKAKDLLYAMLLPSGNDAAYTVGYHIGLSNVNNFAYLMTKKARSIGAYNTSFANPHGLDNQNHYSTAYDMAIITKYALNDQYINNAVKTLQKTVDLGSYSKTFNNTNSLLRSYEFTDGVKTGFTNDAGRCLIASATKDDRRYIAVILGAPTTNIRFNEAKKALEYCFEKYKYVDVSEYLKTYVNVKILKGNKKYYEYKQNFNKNLPLKNGEYEKIYVKQEVLSEINAPMNSGQKIGKITLMIDNEILLEEKLYLKENIFKNSMLTYAKMAIKEMFYEYNEI